LVGGRGHNGDTRRRKARRTGRSGHRRPPSLSPRGLTIVGACAALVAGCLVAWTLAGDRPGEDVALETSDGCLPAAASCPVPGAATGPGFVPPGPPGTSTATPPDPGASATPGGTTTTTPRTRASGQPEPTRRAVKRVTPPSPAVASKQSASRRSSTAPTLTVDYAYRSRWDDGYVVLIRLTNRSPATWNGWVLSFRLGDGSRITSSWNTRLTSRNGLLRAADDDVNAVVSPGEEAYFGMEGTRSFQPSGCTLNRQPCTFRFAESARGHGRGRNW